jgi:hypothetical protein
MAGRISILAGAREVSLLAALRLALGPTQPFIQWATVPLCTWVKRPDHEAKNGRAVRSPAIRFHGMVHN